MKNQWNAVLKSWGFFLLGGLAMSQSVSALELDWSGQFWAEFNYVHNYAMDATGQGSGYDSARATPKGYYAPGGGTQDATFQSLFLRLRPKLVVNDNIYIKSEFWVGDPIYGMFGNAVPYSVDQRQFYSSQARGSFIAAQRVWGEFITDIGTFQVGRLPLHWGLGVVWNSGENLWDRYMSTGDSIRWVAKFGSFSFIPSFIVNSTGNSIAGSCNVSGTTCTPGGGAGGVSDYSLILKYENTEDELEGGINLIKRLAGPTQDSVYGIQTTQGQAAYMNFVTYDLYAKKKLNRFTFGAEVPIVSGALGGASYQTFGVATEINWKTTDILDLNLKVGYAPGQTNFLGGTMDNFKAFYFNPNYHIGMVMFNYQLANFAGPQTQNNPNLAPNQLKSPYDNPIVNAQYLSLGAQIKPWDKWTIRPGFVYAVAPQSAASGQTFFNYWTKTIQTAVKDQAKDLGWEVDLGVTFQWDEYFTFSWDNGLYMPGGFYAFSNYLPQDNRTDPVFATSFRVGVNF